ncbi:MAG: M13 family metallopeptidase [Gammaproteobacteria bacterium]
MFEKIRAVVCLAVVAALQVSIASGAGRASIGDFGFDSTGMDRSVKPGNDFNAFANGAWVQRSQVPADRASWGVWNVLEEQANDQMRGILETAARAHAPLGSNSQKIGDYYGGFMDETTIEKRGIEPLKRQLAAIRSIRSYAGLAIALGKGLRVGDSMPISLEINVDFKNPKTYSAYASQGGLGLPDRDYYLRNDEAVKKTQAAYLKYLMKLFVISKLAVDEADVDRRARAVFDLEHRLAQVQWTRVQQRNLLSRYKPWQQADYMVKAPGLDWNAFFKAAGLAGQQMIVASMDSAIVGTAAVIPTVPLSEWRDYLAIRAIDRHAQYLDERFVAAHFAFHETALAGTPVLPMRWKRGVRFTERAMGEAIGPLYVEKHFSGEAKASAQRLVNDLLVAAGKRINGLEWMSQATKARASEKLATFGVKIGYPENWRDYSKLPILAGKAYENALAADRFEYDRNLAKLGQPIDRTEWDMTPMTVNASYNPLKNEIIFPAAVLQPPFFDANADSAVNYGSIGTIIGHEISHGFDDQGRLFDAHGAMTDWWSQADAAKYKERAAAFVAQYSAYEVLPGLHLNGELTLSENIADNAGIVIAYDAYRGSLGDQVAPFIDGLSGDQRFFLGFAQGYRTIWREPSLRQQTTTNSHAPNAIRVRTVRNVAAWYAAYDVKPGELLFLPPAARATIW